MPSDRLVSSKEALRRRCRRFRSALDSAAYARLSAQIVERALAEQLFDSAQVIHIYWPAIDRQEVDTRPLIEHLFEAGKSVVIPAVDPHQKRLGGTMIYRAFEGAGNMQKNEWGTYEPLATNTVPPAAVDLVVAPALCADRLGHRLGYGGGFYDRFLKQADCAVLSLVYSACLFDFVPFGDHDVKVDSIVTENEVVRPGVAATSRPLDRIP